MKMNTEASKEETQMANKHFQKNSTPSATMEMQLKITLRFQFTLVTRAIVPCGEMALQEKVLAMQTCKSDLDLCTTSKVRWGSICNLAFLQWEGRLKGKNRLGASWPACNTQSNRSIRDPPFNKEKRPPRCITAYTPSACTHPEHRTNGKNAIKDVGRRSPSLYITEVCQPVQ